MLPSKILLLGLLTPVIGYSLGIRLPNQDPTATARGNAFAATADNASAIYYNPAGIAQLEASELRASVYTVRVEHEYSAGGTSLKNKDEWQPVPSLYYAAPIKDRPYSWGISVNAPYGQASEWPENSPFNSLGVAGEVRYLSVSPAFAIKVNEWLYLGTALHLDKAELELEQVIPLSTLKTKITGDSFAPSATVGVLARFDRHSFGLTYRFQTVHDIDGQVDVPFVGTFDYDSKITFPDHLILGYAYRLGQWTFEANVDWTHWSKFDSLDLGVVGSIPFEWKNSYFYELGAQWESEDQKTKINFGYTYNENSIPDENFNPLIIDSDRHFLSVGIERRIYPGWSIQGSAQYGWSVDRDVTAALGNGFQNPNGNYSTEILAFHLGISGQF